MQIYDRRVELKETACADVKHWSVPTNVTALKEDARKMCTHIYRPTGLDQSSRPENYISKCNREGNWVKMSACALICPAPYGLVTIPAKPGEICISVPTTRSAARKAMEAALAESDTVAEPAVAFVPPTNDDQGEQPFVPPVTNWTSVCILHDLSRPPPVPWSKVEELIAPEVGEELTSGEQRSLDKYDPIGYASSSTWDKYRSICSWYQLSEYYYKTLWASVSPELVPPLQVQLDRDVCWTNPTCVRVFKKLNIRPWWMSASSADLMPLDFTLWKQISKRFYRSLEQYEEPSAGEESEVLCKSVAADLLLTAHNSMPVERLQTAMSSRYRRALDCIIRKGNWADDRDE